MENKKEGKQQANIQEKTNTTRAAKILAYGFFVIATVL